MKTKPCEVCGNDIESGLSTCPFCERPQSTGSCRVRSDKVVTVNIERGMPSVEEAMRRLDGELLRAQNGGARLVRVIHGWGSSGQGGKIRAAVRSHLAGLQQRKVIRGFVPGDAYSKATEAGRRLLSAYPALRDQEVPDRENPGITFVELVSAFPLAARRRTE